jgi:prepilin-type N-terminal cleavage/methylation domain-containing protein
MEEPMVRFPRRVASEAGFSLIELLVVIALMGVLSTMAVIQIAASRPGLVGDGAARVIIGQVNQAREMAITQRHYMRVVFTAPNTVQIVREDTPLTTTNIGSALLEGGMAYALVSSLPDTPDAFGNSTPISFGAVTNIKFTPDGTLVNQDGQIVNGGVFVAMANQAASARAVTILGSTGRIRLYKWNGKAWILG